MRVYCAQQKFWPEVIHCPKADKFSLRDTWFLGPPLFTLSANTAQSFHVCIRHWALPLEYLFSISAVKFQNYQNLAEFPSNWHHYYFYNRYSKSTYPVLHRLGKDFAIDLWQVRGTGNTLSGHASSLLVTMHSALKWIRKIKFEMAALGAFGNSAIVRRVW